MNLLNDDFGWISREDLIQNKSATKSVIGLTNGNTQDALRNILRQDTILSTFHIETFNLDRCLCPLLELDSRIFLLLQ